MSEPLPEKLKTGCGGEATESDEAARRVHCQASRARGRFVGCTEQRPGLNTVKRVGDYYFVNSEN